MLAMEEMIPPLEPIYKKVEADSRFSLYYLKAVDAVVTVTTNLRNDADTADKVIKQLNARIVDPGFSKPIDPDGQLASLAASAENVVKEAISAVRGLGDVMREAEFPTDDAEEISIVSEEAIISLQLLHDSMVDLRWAVLEHDADLEKPEDKVFDNVKDLVADLKSL